MRRKQENLFKVFIAKIKEILESGRRPILIIDEIQKLRDLYIENGNGEKEFLKEFLNFCVRLTKETHFSHVVILTSNTVFIERIYNDARLKKTSAFYKIDHLTREKVEEWLKIEGFKEEGIEMIWEYLGGCIADILKVLEEYRKDKNLKEFLDREAWLAYTEIDEFLAEFKGKDVDCFKEAAKSKEKREFLAKWAEREILFYDPLELKIFPNSKIYTKGFEIWLGRM